MSPAGDPFFLVRQERTSFHAGDVVPGFYPGPDGAQDRRARECYLSFLFCCTTNCYQAVLPLYPDRRAEPLILVVNCFLLKKKRSGFELGQPLPAFTRNFLFTIKPPRDEYVSSVPMPLVAADDMGRRRGRDGGPAHDDSFNNSGTGLRASKRRAKSVNFASK